MSLPLAPIVSIRRLSLVLGGPAAACTRRQAHSRDWDSTQNEAQSQRQHTVGVRRVAAFAVAFLGSTAGAALQAAAGGGRRRAAAAVGGRWAKLTPGASSSSPRKSEAPVATVVCAGSAAPQLLVHVDPCGGPTANTG